jgi:sarcosine oxidase
MMHDVAILGLGAMGSAAACHLARRGLKVLGLDQFEPPHTHGSSHGETRVIREAYFEHPIYVPLVQRAYQLWEELERETGQQLYRKTGGLMLGIKDGIVVSGSIRSAQEHHLAHEILDNAEVTQRFPGLTPSPGMNAVLEPRAGIVFPEKCVAAHLALARKFGAELRTGETATAWTPAREHVEIKTDRGTYTARKLIVTAGAWLPRLFPALAPVLTVERQVLLWFEALDPALFTPDRFPIHLWEYEPNKMFYGFADLGDGVKVAFHHQGETTDPSRVNRTVTDADITSMRNLLDRFLPQANGRFLRGAVCLYTNTPDGHFIIDFQPDSDRVILASPCSGHGFKFASAIGEVLADLAMTGRCAFDLTLFRADRFGPGLATP